MRAASLLGLALLLAPLPDAGAKIPIDLHIIGFDVSPEVQAQLEAAARAGGGHYYQSNDEIQLTQALGQATGLAPADTGTAPTEDVIMVLDVSSSMWGQVEGRPKIEIAREGVAALLSTWNPQARLGLFAYGHRRVGDCTDIEQVLPVGPVDATAFMSTVDGLTPTGKTPLTEAVREAAQALSYEDHPATVILFSDGIETCNADPCALATELERTGVRFTAHVIGFDVQSDTQQLACLAQATGGLFLTADNASQLSQALQTIGTVAANPALSDLITLEAVDAKTGAVFTDGVAWTVVAQGTEDSVPISAGVSRPSLPLDPGSYLAIAARGGVTGQEPFDVVDGQAATIQVKLTGAATGPGTAIQVSCGEPNDSFGTAGPADLATGITGSIDPQRDGDFCAVTVPGAGVLSVAAAQLPPGIDLVWRVFDGNDATVRDWSTPLVVGQPGLVADLPAAGRYVLEIRDSYEDATSPDPYALTLGFTPAVDSTEPNDSFGQASPLPLGGSVEVAVFPTREHDFHEVVVPEQGELTVTATAVPPGLDIALRAFDADYATLRDWVSPAQPGQDTIMVVDLPAAGRYVIETADSYDDARDPAPYALTARFVPTGDAAEPNDRLSTAGPLAFDMPTRGAILPRRDGDYFAVEVDHRGELKVVASAVPANIDVAIRLFDANYAVVQDWAVPSAPGQDTVFVADLPAPGRYVIEVRDSYEDARSVSPYMLTAGFTPAEDATEPNDRFTGAVPLALGAPVSTSILPRRDGDMFVLDAAMGPLTVKATGVPPMLDVALRLYNSDLAVVRDWAVPSQPGQDTILAADLPAAGRYYLEVRDSYDDSRSPLSFTVTATQP